MSNISQFLKNQFSCENGQFSKGLTYGNWPFPHENWPFPHENFKNFKSANISPRCWKWLRNQGSLW